MERYEARALGALGYWTASNGTRALELQASGGLSGREFAWQTGSSQNRLWWDRTGFALLMKRLEGGTFRMVAPEPGAARS